MGPYDLHILVCTTGKTCPRQGSEAVHSELRRRVKEAGLTHTVRVNKCGCMAQCGYGPMLVVYPDNVWYSAVRVEDVPEIFESHLQNGQPVTRLLHRPPGRGIQICKPGEEPIPPAPLEAS